MNNFKAVIKMLVKKIIAVIAIPLLKVAIVILTFSIIVILVTYLWDALVDAFSKETGEKMDEYPVKYEVGVKDENGGGASDVNIDPYSIEIDQEQIKFMEKLLEDIGTSKYDLHLTDKYLEKMYAAEVVSKEINRSYRLVDRNGTPTPTKSEELPDKYYGRVYMNLASDSTDSTSLCFVDYKKFKDLEYMRKVIKNTDDIINYFSVNDKGQLCLASTVVTYDEEGNEKSSEITINEVDYKEKLQGYMMPVEFLLDLALLTENPEFIAGFPDDPEIPKGLAEKVLKDTQIYLTVRYTEIITDKTTTYTYDLETKTDKTTTKKNSLGIEDTSTTETSSSTKIEPVEPQINKERTVEKKPSFSVTYADTWFLKQKFNYPKIQLGPKKLDPKINEFPNSEWEEIRTESSESEKDIISIKMYSRKSNQKETIEKEITEFRYNPGVIENPTYKVKDFLDLLATEFDIPDTFVKQSAIGKVMDGAGVLLQMLSNNRRTQAEEQIMRYIFNYSSGSTLYGDIDIDTLNDFFIDRMVALSKNDIVVDTLKCDQKLILDQEQLKDAIDKRYTGQMHDNLYDNINAFIEMQNTHNVNAVFAIAVTIIESSGGTNWAAIAPETHNWMSVTGSYNGQSYRNPESSNDRTWRVYKSFAEATMDFGNLIANSSYYFQNNRHSVESIAPTYCNERWGNKVVTEMMSIYATIGIDISGQNSEDNNEGTPL